ncbi:unnamed protein product [Pedinophyceae sp. YPF-701]|nr:unnamed protein product [Pedinophyceae sp. YPF-701]
MFGKVNRAVRKGAETAVSSGTRFARAVVTGGRLKRAKDVSASLEIAFAGIKGAERTETLRQWAPLLRALCPDAHASDAPEGDIAMPRPRAEVRGLGITYEEALTARYSLQEADGDLDARGVFLLSPALECLVSSVMTHPPTDPEDQRLIASIFVSTLQTTQDGNTAADGSAAASAIAKSVISLAGVAMRHRSTIKMPPSDLTRAAAAAVTALKADPRHALHASRAATLASGVLAELEGDGAGDAEGPERIESDGGSSGSWKSAPGSKTATQRTTQLRDVVGRSDAALASALTLSHLLAALVTSMDYAGSSTSIEEAAAGVAESAKELQAEAERLTEERAEGVRFREQRERELGESEKKHADELAELNTQRTELLKQLKECEESIAKATIKVSEVQEERRLLVSSNEQVLEDIDLKLATLQEQQTHHDHESAALGAAASLVAACASRHSAAVDARSAEAQAAALGAAHALLHAAQASLSHGLTIVEPALGHCRVFKKEIGVSRGQESAMAGVQDVAGSILVDVRSAYSKLRRRYLSASGTAAAALAEGNAAARQCEAAVQRMAKVVSGAAAAAQDLPSDVETGASLAGATELLARFVDWAKGTECEKPLEAVREALSQFEVFEKEYIEEHQDLTQELTLELQAPPAPTAPITEAVAAPPADAPPAQDAALAAEETPAVPPAEQRDAFLKTRPWIRVADATSADATAEAPAAQAAAPADAPPAAAAAEPAAAAETEADATVEADEGQAAGEAKSEGSEFDEDWGADADVGKGGEGSGDEGEEKEAGDGGEGEGRKGEGEGVEGVEGGEEDAAEPVMRPPQGARPGGGKKKKKKGGRR